MKSGFMMSSSNTSAYVFNKIGQFIENSGSATDQIVQQHNLDNFKFQVGLNLGYFDSFKKNCEAEMQSIESFKVGSKVFDNDQSQFDKHIDTKLEIEVVDARVDVCEDPTLIEDASATCEYKTGFQNLEIFLDIDKNLSQYNPTQYISTTGQFYKEYFCACPKDKF